MNTSIAGMLRAFVPLSLANDSAQYDRYQLFVAVSMALLVVIVLAQAYALSVGSLYIEIPWTLAFTVPLQLTLIVALVYFRLFGQFLRVVGAVLSVMFVTLVGVVYHLGGPLGGVSVVMSFVVPMFAFVLLGLKAGIGWGVLTYVMLMAGGAMDVAGFQFPYVDTTAYASVGKVIQLNVAFFTIFIMVAFYEIDNFRHRAELELFAGHDDLTQLPNRGVFYKAMEAAIKTYQRSTTPFMLIYIDLDDFKAINDKYGHGAGDQVLQAFSGRLKSSVRSKEFVCRLGGDEFAILINDSVDERIAHLALDRLQEKLKDPIVLRNGQRIEVSASAGVAFYPRDALSLEDILHTADERMYMRKRDKLLSAI